MKKSEFVIEMSRKAMNTIKAIIKTEDLSLTVKVTESALGDTLIVASGSTADVKILRGIYNMMK